MAKKKRLSPNKLAEIKSNFAGLKSIPDYAPAKAEYRVAEIQPIEDAIDELTEQESQILAQLGAVRDQLADRGYEFTQKIKGAAQQIIGQFGDDSPEIQKLGRKRSSERAAPRPRQNKPNP